MLCLPFGESEHQTFSFMQLERGGRESSSWDMKTTMTSTFVDSKLHAKGSVRSHPSNEKLVNEKLGKDVELQGEDIKEPIKAAKVYGFCFGIPFGKIYGVSLFKKSIDSSHGDFFYRGDLLSLSTFSLKVLRQGKSNLQLTLGQTYITWLHFLYLL
ncbi:hypothetical protein MKX01_006219, partial [Papaver californicum]